MDKIYFKVSGQSLVKTGGLSTYASDTVEYIQAEFTLNDDWNEYDSIRAIWQNGDIKVPAVISQDKCMVPFEVLVEKGTVSVNLVASSSDGLVLTKRITSYPIKAFNVTVKVNIDGSDPQTITPSQFEQFVAIVIAEVEKVTGMTAQAETLPAGSQATARYENGILYLGIPQGIQGERGETGADGNGIASVVYNADYSLTLVFDNGERFTTPPIRGERGPAGADGRDGADGVTPNLSVGNVETLEPTQDAYVTRRGTDDNPIFDFGIPRGQNGTVPDLDLILPTDTASGDIASITDGQSVVPVKSLKVTLEPIQSGSGTPSPDNVRPISGRTECVTIVSPTTDAEDGTSYTASLGRTVYGGTIEQVGGQLTDKMVLIDLGSLTWVSEDSAVQGQFRATYAGNPTFQSDTPDYYGSAVCSAYPFGGRKAWNALDDKSVAFSNGEGADFMLRLRDATYTGMSADAFKTAMDGVQLCYELATPQTYQLDPQTISLLHGNNNVWSDGEVELTYNADVQLWVLKKLS